MGQSAGRARNTRAPARWPTQIQMGNAFECRNVPCLVSTLCTRRPRQTWRDVWYNVGHPCIHVLPGSVGVPATCSNMHA